MSDPELNAKIARLMGFRVEPFESHLSGTDTTDTRYWQFEPDGSPHGQLHRTEEECWRDASPDYSGDPKACAGLRQHVAKLADVWNVMIQFHHDSQVWTGLVEYHSLEIIRGDGSTEEQATARACCAALEALSAAKEPRDE